MVSRMPSFGFFLGSSLVVVVYCLSLGGEALAESASNLVGNGNFEELKGYFPAGVMVRRGRTGKGHFLPHWKVSERGAPVEIISSLFWQSSLGSHDSRYAVHLNTRVGPGGIQTEFPSPWRNTSFFGKARYQLSVDVAGNPNGGSAVKLMEVLVSPSDCRSQKLSVTVARDANSKRLNWETHVLALNVHGSEPTVMLQFRSLTPGAYGPLIDNVRLVPQGDVFDSELCDGNSDEEMKERPVKTLTKQLVERMWMSAETWFRQRFLRREDW